jgi:hypothetical protein
LEKNRVLNGGRERKTKIVRNNPWWNNSGGTTGEVWRCLAMVWVVVAGAIFGVGGWWVGGRGRKQNAAKKKLLFFVFLKKNIYKSWLSRVRLTSKKIVYFTEEMLLRSITLKVRLVGPT